MRAKYIIILALAFCLFVGALSAPAMADTYKTLWTGYVQSGELPLHPNDAGSSTVTITIPAALNNTTPGYVNLVVSSPDYPGMNTTLFVGQSAYYWNDMRIYVSEIDPVTKDNLTTYQAYVTIDQIGASSSTSTGTALTCDTPGMTALGGDTVVFPINIQNNNGVDKTYTLSAINDMGYTTSFQYNNKDIYQVYVPSGQSKIVNLLVGTSYETTIGPHTITVSSGDATLNVNVDITSINQSANVNVQLDSQIANIGDKVYYQFSIQNLQAQQNDYHLSVTGLPDNWDYQYLASTSSANQMAEEIVPAQSTSNFVLQILPPYSVSEGTYNFTAVITTPGNVTISEPLTLTLNGGVSMTVNYDQLAYTSQPGQTFSFNVYVTNNGKGGALTNVYPSITAPSGWVVSSSPNMTNSIKAGETQTYTITVQSPGNIVASDYDVNVVVKSDQAQSSSYDFRITIATSSYTMYIAGAIVLVVVVGLFFMYRKYGRR